MNNTQLRRMKSICKIVIALHIAVFVLLVILLIFPNIIPAFMNIFININRPNDMLEYFDYEHTYLWDIIKAYSVSIVFLPKWLSPSVLAILLSVRIADFIWVFKKFSLGVSKGEAEYREKKNKYNFIHILGIIVTPVWFSMISFYGMNFGKAGEFYANINSEIFWYT